MTSMGRFSPVFPAKSLTINHLGLLMGRNNSFIVWDFLTMARICRKIQKTSPPHCGGDKDNIKYYYISAIAA